MLLIQEDTGISVVHQTLQVTHDKNPALCLEKTLKFMLCPLYSRDLRKTAVESCEILSVYSHIITYLVPDTGLNTETRLWNAVDTGLEERTLLEEVGDVNMNILMKKKKVKVLGSTKKEYLN